jgi:hypothetical protein
LQRTERELLAENQDLTRKLAALKQHHERQAQQWNKGARRKEIEAEFLMRELGKKLVDFVSRHPQNLPGIPSNDEIWQPTTTTIHNHLRCFRSCCWSQQYLT